MNNIIKHSFQINKQSPIITLECKDGFEKINMIRVYSNKIPKTEEPFGLRWSLINNNQTINCFNWQLPGQLEFNCFEVTSVFELSEWGTKNYFNKMCIKKEGDNFDDETVIYIELETQELQKHN